MTYRRDAHHYRDVVRGRKRKRTMNRVKAVVLFTVSFVLLFYAVPCFAASVWDYDDTSSSGLLFSTAVNDHSNDAAAAGESASAAKSESYSLATSTSDTLIADTVGPGALANSDAVELAKTRAQALDAAEGKTSVASIEGQSGVASHTTVTTQQIVFAYIALIVSIVCAILGMRIMVRQRKMRDFEMTASYNMALRA